MELQNDLLQQAAATLEVEITEEQINDVVEKNLKGFQEQLAQQGLTLEMYCQFTNTKMEDLRKTAAPEARQQILCTTAIDKIVELEQLEATQEEIQQVREQICRSNGITMEMLDAMHDPELEKIVKQRVLNGKALALVRQAAEITE